jgi:catechol 2,3-dioxygenase-like lactoylglutathione lyase family enzyme
MMSNQGIVSARHVDHVGMTVPDLEEAIRFFEDALGGLLLWRVGPFHSHNQNSARGGLRK